MWQFHDGIACLNDIPNDTISTFHKNYQIENYFVLSFSSKHDTQNTYNNYTDCLCFFISLMLPIGNCVPVTAVFCEWTLCSRSTDWRTCCRWSLISPTKAARGPTRTCTASKLVSAKTWKNPDQICSLFCCTWVESNVQNNNLNKLNEKWIIVKVCFLYLQV